MKKEQIDELECEIMDWFYDTVRVAFEVEMIQNASDLREILDAHLSKI